MKFHRYIVTAFAAALLSTMPASATHPSGAEKPTVNVVTPGENQPAADQYAAAASTKQHIEQASEAADHYVVDDMLDYAKKYIGRPYRRGTAGPKTFDCSGFTSYVMHQFGYELSRDSRSQYTQGTAVKRNEAQPGDLIFFSGRAAGKTVGHVGIVTDVNPLTGSITFIHASTSRGVRIDNLGDAYYSRRFIGIKRVLTPEDLGLL